MNAIREIIILTGGDVEKRQELYGLLFDPEIRVAYQAAWVLTHLPSQETGWLCEKQNELTDMVLASGHGGFKRLLLSLLYKLPFTDPPRVDFLDFCLERMISREEPVAVQSLCIKIAYELCKPIPELLQELQTMLEVMEDVASPAIRGAKMNTLKAIRKTRYKNGL